MNIVIIPARFASTRFPGKPLADICGKTMIQHVFERALQADVDDVVVATDDTRIFDEVMRFGGKVVMTSQNHASGTDRCGEAAQKLNLSENDIIVNVQGDEPFIRSEEINLLLKMFENKDVNIATLVMPITDETEVNNPNKVKVVFSHAMKALYFSRFPIPFVRGELSDQFYKHIGIYAYRLKTLIDLTNLTPSILENAEKLEQLRWLENDQSIYVSKCYYESLSVDTPEDLEKILKMNSLK